MSVATGLINEVYFVRWIEPAQDDVQRVVEEARDSKGKAGVPIRYLAIIGADLKPPSDEVRKGMRQTIDSLLEHCESVHLVIEGRGLRRAMARSIGTSVFLLSKNRGRTFAHDSVGDALRRIGYEDERERTNMLEQARAQDLLWPESM